LAGNRLINHSAQRCAYLGLNGGGEELGQLAETRVDRQAGQHAHQIHLTTVLVKKIFYYSYNMDHMGHKKGGDG
jgi:hypothetical protein